MAKSKGGLGVAFCRKRKARTGYPLITIRDQPPDMVWPTHAQEWDPGGEVHVSFASSDNEHYRTMLAVIRQARTEALATPRVDMPGADITPGECRLQVPMAVPENSPRLTAELRPDGAVKLSWRRTADNIGLRFEVHRGAKADFTPGESTRQAVTIGGQYVDTAAPAGRQYYALLVTDSTERSKPAFASIEVPKAGPAAGKAK